MNVYFAPNAQLYTATHPLSAANEGGYRSGYAGLDRGSEWVAARSCSPK